MRTAIRPSGMTTSTTALHVLLTGEVGGYYSDYQDAAIDLLGRCLVEGYAWQGEKSPYAEDQPRGEASR